MHITPKFPLLALEPNTFASEVGKRFDALLEAVQFIHPELCPDEQMQCLCSYFFDGLDAELHHYLDNMEMTAALVREFKEKLKYLLNTFFANLCTQFPRNETYDHGWRVYAQLSESMLHGIHSRYQINLLTPGS